MSENNKLRDETGALIGGLVVFDYNAGWEDYEAGNPPPDMTSPSYDLGRQRAAEKEAEKAESKRTALRWLEEEERRGMERMKAILPPEHFEEYRRKMAELRARHSRP